MTEKYENVPGLLGTDSGFGPGDFPLGSPESRAAARMRLRQQQDSRSRPRTLAEYSDNELSAMTSEELLAAMGVKIEYGARAEASSLKELGAMIRLEMKYGSDDERLAALRSTDAELADLILAKRGSKRDGAAA